VLFRSTAVATELARLGVADAGLAELPDYTSARQMQSQLRKRTQLTAKEILTVIDLSATGTWQVPTEITESDGVHWGLSIEQLVGLRRLHGESFARAWQFKGALQKTTSAWQEPAAEVDLQVKLLLRTFRQ